MFKKYYLLTKPGIIYGNAIAAIAGFFLAEKGEFHLLLFLGMLGGLSLIIASACVCNNCIDKDIDAKMERTKKRALAVGTIPLRNALFFAGLLGFTGIILLFLLTNILTLVIALLGWFFYVVIYTLLKRKTMYGTEIGSISGAVPPVVGYTAVTNRFDIGALLLFLILVFWQMPHFFAIAIRRKEEYKAAKIPILPLVTGIKRTKIEIIFYIVAFVISSLLLTFLGYTGKIYFVVISILGVLWLIMAIQGFSTKDDLTWAKKVFLFSLVVLLVWSLSLSLSPVLF